MRSVTVLLMIIYPILGFAGEKYDCGNPVTTIEVNYCKGREVEHAEKDMEKYLKAAIERNKRDIEMVKLIEQSQIEWLQYREKHCDAIYQMWSGGTIRGVMYGECKLRLTKSRAYELWLSYLTYMDSTPPVLPEPTK